MIVNDFLKRVSVRLGDAERISFDNKELICALNDGITQLSLERIASNDPDMIKEMKITPGSTSVPSGFVRFVGQEPVYAAGGKFVALDSTVVPVTIRCYVAKPHVETKGDDLPFDDATSLGVLLDYVVALVGARVGYTSQIESSLAARMSDAYTGKAVDNAGAVQTKQ